MGSSKTIDAIRTLENPVSSGSRMSGYLARLAAQSSLCIVLLSVSFRATNTLPSRRYRERSIWTLYSNNRVGEWRQTFDDILSLSSPVYYLDLYVRIPLHALNAYKTPSKVFFVIYIFTEDSM